MIKRLLGFCLLPLLLLAACGEDSDPTRNNDFIPLTGITIEPARTETPAGFTIRFTAIGDFSGAFSRAITGEVNWSSSDPSVISFVEPETGKARSGVPGTVFVTASHNGVESTLSFKVNEEVLQTIVIDPSTANVAKGLTQKFEAEGLFSDGTSFRITEDVSWTSSDTTLVTLDATALATAVAVGGPVTVTAGFPKEATTPAFTGTATMTVTEPVVEALRLTPAPNLLIIDETHQLSAVPVLSDGTELPPVTAAWSSSNSTVASVDAATGLVTAKGIGTATITAIDAASTFTGTITVTVGTVSSIAVALADAAADQTIGIGEALQLKATATMSNGTTREITSFATWTTSNSQAVTVDNATRGRVVGNALGAADISANVGTGAQRVSGTLRITVSQ